MVTRSGGRLGRAELASAVAMGQVADIDFVLPHGFLAPAAADVMAGTRGRL